MTAATKPARKPAAAPKTTKAKASGKAKPAAKKGVADGIMALLTRDGGCTHQDLLDLTHWKSCRAYPKGLAKKRGMTVVVERIEGGRGKVRYRAVPAEAAPTEAKAA